MTTMTNTYIPNDTSPESIVLAIAYLIGCDKIKTELRDDNYFAGYNRKQVNTTPHEGSLEKYGFVLSIVSFALGHYVINIQPTKFDKQVHCGNLYLIPDAEHVGYFTLTGGHCGFWQRIGMGLVDTFGGYVDFDDGDKVVKDYEKEKPRSTNCPINDESWQKFQADLLDIKPFTSIK